MHAARFITTSVATLTLLGAGIAYATDGPSTSGPSTGGPSTSGPSVSGPATNGPATAGPSTSGPAASVSPDRGGNMQGQPSARSTTATGTNASAATSAATAVTTTTPANDPSNALPSGATPPLNQETAQPRAAIPVLAARADRN